MTRLNGRNASGLVVRDREEERRAKLRRDLRGPSESPTPKQLQGAKARARRAAAELGVPEPEWLEDRTPPPAFSAEHRRKLSEGRRHVRAPEEGR